MSTPRFNARVLAVAAVAVILLGGTSRADKLHWVEGGGPAPVMLTFDLASEVLTTAPITNLTPDEQVVGMCTPQYYPWFPPLFGQIVSVSVSDETLFTEDTNTFEHRVRGYSLATGGAFNGSINNDAGVFNGIVGYQQHSTESPYIATWNATSKPSANYRVAIGTFGEFYVPGTKVTPAIYIDSLDLDGRVIATTKSPGGRVLLLTDTGKKSYLYSVRCLHTPATVPPYKVQVMGRFEVTYPSGYFGGRLVTIAMKQDKADKQIYALVQTYETQPGNPKPLGEVVLCKGKVINGKLDMTKVTKVQDWGYIYPYIDLNIVPMVVR